MCQRYVPAVHHMCRQAGTNIIFWQKPGQICHPWIYVIFTLSCISDLDRGFFPLFCILLAFYSNALNYATEKAKNCALCILATAAHWQWHQNVTRKRALAWRNLCWENLHWLKYDITHHTSHLRSIQWKQNDFNMLDHQKSVFQHQIHMHTYECIICTAHLHRVMKGRSQSPLRQRVTSPS